MFQISFKEKAVLMLPQSPMRNLILGNSREKQFHGFLLDHKKQFSRSCLKTRDCKEDILVSKHKFKGKEFSSSSRYTRFSLCSRWALCCLTDQSEGQPIGPQGSRMTTLGRNCGLVYPLKKQYCTHTNIEWFKTNMDFAQTQIWPL